MFNPFETLGLEPSFKLDETLLEKRYFDLQSLSHPDRFVGEGRLDFQAAGASSAKVNQAYETLKNPVLRAESLIEVAGGIVPGRGGASTQDPAALEAAMELREELDNCENPAILEQFRTLVEDRLTACYEEFSTAWESKNCDHMQKTYIHLTYLKKVIDEIKGRVRQSLEERA